MKRGPYQPEEDLIIWMLRLAVDQFPELAPNGRPDKVIRIEQRARIEWGGKRPYIPKPRRRKPDGS